MFMKRFWFLLAILLCGTTLSLFIGCSNDDDGGTDSTTQPGDTTAGNFQFVQDSVGDAPFMSLSTTLELSLGLLESLPGAPTSERGMRRVSLAQDGDWHIVEITWNYAYESPWHRINYDAVAVNPSTNDTADLAGTDSLRLLVNNVPVQYPSASVNALNIRNHFTWAVRSAEDSIKADHLLNITGDVVNETSYLTVNGSGTDVLYTQVSDGQTTCDLDVTYTPAVNNIQVYVGYDECPFAGNLSINTAISLTCTGGSAFDSLNIEGAWTITASYSDSLETITYTNGGTTWTVTRPCMNTNPEDRAYHAFLEQFSNEEGSGFADISDSMATRAFKFIGAIFDMGATLPVRGRVALGDTAIEYSDGWWVITVNDTNYEENEYFTFVDSFQFRHDDQPVQYPDTLLLTEILVHDWLYVIGDKFDTAWADQMLVLTSPSSSLDTIVVNGTGDMVLRARFVDYSYDPVVDSTVCEVDMSWGLTLNDIGLDMDSFDGMSLPCPFTGTQVYTAELDNVCIGQYPGVLTGNWLVNAAFDAGSVSATVSNGSSSWQINDTCD
jgi:hypothetical protein